MSKFIPLAALFLAHEAVAWWDSGHYLAACVARQTLISKDRQDVVDGANKLMALYDENGFTNDLCRAAVWMDWIKLYKKGQIGSTPEHPILPDISGFGSLHYIDFPTGPLHDGPTEAEIEDYLSNATYVHMDALLSNAMYLMPAPGKDKIPEDQGTIWGHNLIMRWLLHLMGDAHQPMHMTAMFWADDQYDCNGQWTGADIIKINSNDAGGNGIKVELASDVTDPKLIAAKPTSLHLLWDSMGGYGSVPDHGDLFAFEITDEEMFAKANDLISNYSPEKAIADGFSLTDFTLKEIYKATAFLAATPEATWGRFAYEGIEIPKYFCPGEFSNNSTLQNECCQAFPVTKDYADYVLETSKKLVALAGYRIAWILEKWWDGLSDRLTNELEDEYIKQTQTPTACPTESPTACPTESPTACPTESPIECPVCPEPGTTDEAPQTTGVSSLILGSTAIAAIAAGALLQ